MADDKQGEQGEQIADRDLKHAPRITVHPVIDGHAPQFQGHAEVIKPETRGRHRVQEILVGDHRDQAHDERGDGVVHDLAARVSGLDQLSVRLVHPACHRPLHGSE